MQIDDRDPSLPDASRMLAEMEAAEDAADKATAIAPPDSDSASQPDRAGQSPTEVVPSTDSKPGGTPATEEPKPQDKPAEKPADGKAQSKYAENQQRLQGGWKTLNAEKETLKKERESFQRERDAMVAERKQLEDERQKLAQPKFKPEDYEAFAKQQTQLASQWKAHADKLEGEGKYDEADKARDNAKALRNQSNQARQQAEYLRANPPKPTPTAEQTAKEFEDKRKEWYGKAVQDFPALKDKNSDAFKKLTATITKGAEGYDPIIEEVVNRSPEGMYYAGRLIVAETLAASVAQKEKELVELRAKVKELDEKTAIPTDGVAQRQAAKKSDSEMTDDELLAELQAEAMRRGTL